MEKHKSFSACEEDDCVECVVKTVMSSLDGRERQRVKGMDVRNRFEGLLLALHHRRPTEGG